MPLLNTKSLADHLSHSIRSIKAQYYILLTLLYNICPNSPYLWSLVMGFSMIFPSSEFILNLVQTPETNCQFSRHPMVLTQSRPSIPLHVSWSWPNSHSRWLWENTFQKALKPDFLDINSDYTLFCWAGWFGVTLNKVLTVLCTWRVHSFQNVYLLEKLPGSNQHYVSLLKK